MKVIAVISGKGGVGKTTTVANVGTALTSEFKRKIALIDGNPNTPDLSIHLGLYTVEKTLKEVLERKMPIKEALMHLPSGVELLASPLAVGEETDIHGLGTFLKELEDYELVIVDSPPGLGKDIESNLEMADEVIIVTNLEIPAVTQALKAIVTVRRAGVPIRGIVLNMVRGEAYELTAMEAELVFDAPVIAVVPEDKSVRESIALGKPVVLSSPSSPASTAFKRLAAQLVGIEYTPHLMERLKAWLKSVFKLGKKAEIPRPPIMPIQSPADDAAHEKSVKEIPRPTPRIEWEHFQEVALTNGVMMPDGKDSGRDRLKDVRRRALEATLERLEQNYQNGLLRENIYNSLKEKYVEERGNLEQA